MRDHLLDEIAELDRQKAAYEEQLSQTDDRTAKYDEIKSEVEKVDSKLAAKRKELEKMTSAAEAAQTEVFSQFENLVFGEGSDQIVLSLRDLCKDESRYQLASQFFQTFVGDMAQTHAIIVNSLESKIVSLEEQNREMETLRAENIRLSDKAADLETKRDAAAMEIAELKDEADRLAEDNEALRNQLKQMATRPGAITSGVDQLELARKIRAEEEAAKPGIYNKRWKDENTKRSYLANLSETGEEIEIPWLEIGKYREETAEDAARFRQAEEERAAKEALELAAKSAENIEAPALSFQDEDDVDGLGGNTTLPEMVGEAVTREEYEALRHEVTMIAVELKARNILPINWEAGAA
jgi:myosin heavy subunit